MWEILNNTTVVYCVMAILIFALTQGLKWVLVKPWTNNIKNEKVRKAVNSTIYFIPYAIGILFEYLYSVTLMQGEFNLAMGVIHGTSGIAFYGIFERIYSLVTGKSSNIENPHQDEIGKAVAEFMGTISKDGKIDADDKPALKAFLDKVK